MRSVSQMFIVITVNFSSMAHFNHSGGCFDHANVGWLDRSISTSSPALDPSTDVEKNKLFFIKWIWMHSSLHRQCWLQRSEQPDVGCRRSRPVPHAPFRIKTWKFADFCGTRDKSSLVMANKPSPGWFGVFLSAATISILVGISVSGELMIF